MILPIFSNGKLSTPNSEHPFQDLEDLLPNPGLCVTLLYSYEQITVFLNSWGKN